MRIQRTFRILEQLSQHPAGCTLTELASGMDVPMSATHRLLTELVECGYVERDPRHGDCRLTMQLVSIGLKFLSSSGIPDIAQPVLDHLARQSGELVRLAVVDRDALVFVAKAQGASQGLRYEPAMGRSITLSCSAAGFAWLATMADDEALERVARQGFGAPRDHGPLAPTDATSLLAHLERTRKRGYGITVDVFQPAMSSMAAVVTGHDGEVGAVLIVAGPAVRLTRQRMVALGPTLLGAAETLSRASGVSPMFRPRSPSGTSTDVHVADAAVRTAAIGCTPPPARRVRPATTTAATGRTRPRPPIPTPIGDP